MAKISIDKAKELLKNETLNKNNDKDIVFGAEKNSSESEIQFIDSYGYNSDDAIYIFDIDGENVITSSDDNLPFILGSYNGEFDVNDMPESLKDWLDTYSREIEWYRINEKALEINYGAEEDDYKKNWKSTSKIYDNEYLLPFKWNQGRCGSKDSTNQYYNKYLAYTIYNAKLNLTSYDYDTENKKLLDTIKQKYCGYVAVGCTQIAIAMTMAYYALVGINGKKYQIGSKKVSARNLINRLDSTSKYKCEELPALTTFDWDNMNNYYDYYNEDGATKSTYIKQKYSETNPKHTSIATFLRYLAQSSNAKCGFTATSNNAANIMSAQKNYFGFNKSMIQFRCSGTSTTSKEFECKIYNELYNKRPVPIAGWNSKNGSGHFFVVDGYRKDDDMWHFNWGWGGHYNGWFKITALNPGGVDDGGNVVTNDSSNFNKNKTIILYDYPTAYQEDIDNHIQPNIDTINGSGNNDEDNNVVVDDENLVIKNKTKIDKNFSLTDIKKFIKDVYW